MRTTFDIDDDVLEAAKERASGERTTAGQVVSELLRRALTASPPGAVAVKAPTAVYGLRPFPAGDVVVTNALIDELRREDAY